MTDQNQFTGQIIYAVPNKEQYEPGEEVILEIQASTEYTRDTWDFIGGQTWETRYEAFDELDRLVGSDSRLHSIAPWTRLDTGEDNFSLRCGRAPESSRNYRLRLQARQQSLPLPPFQFVADVYVPIRIAWQPAPAAVPPATQPAGTPAPAPEPTPAPATVTTPTTDNSQTSFWDAILGRTTAAPASTTSTPNVTATPQKAENKTNWLLPAAIGGLALLLLMKR